MGGSTIESGLRVVVLSCGELGREVATCLDRLSDVSAVALVTAPYRMPERTRSERLVRSLRYDGIASTTRAVARRVAGFLTSHSGREDPGSSVAPSNERISAPVTCRHFATFESDACLAWLRSFAPDLGVVAGTHILPSRVFDLPELGSVNLHMGKAPEYRGSAPAFWELYRGESRVGVTVHRVTEDLDGGRILAQETYPLDEAPAGDPMTYLERYRSEVLRPNGIRLLTDTVRSIAAGRADGRPQDESRATTRGPPTRRDVWVLRARVLRRRIGRRGKHLIGRLLFASGLHRRLLRDRAVVVLFHRVDDALEADPLSCTTAEFRAYCRFFRRHFDVVALDELLDDLEAGNQLTAKLAITFDDGYRDNHRCAAPELERLELPATFFLATAFIGSDGTPWWDRRLAARPEWMDWEEVGDLVDRGFSVGAHSRHHSDLGSVEGEEARMEIEGARRDIADRVGVVTPHFSYPYGGRDHLTERNRRRVRSAGYRSCLSAHGGAVHADTDPYRLPRVPVSGWYVSPAHFGTDLVLTALREPDGDQSRPGREASPDAEATPTPDAHTSSGRSGSGRRD